MSFNFSVNGVLKLLKGLFFALSTALFALLIFAGVFALFGASEMVLEIVKILIKMLAVAVCAFFYSDGKNGILKGAVSGLLTFISLSLTFFIISGGIVDDKIWLSGLFFIIFGIILGIIFANLKKSVNNS